MVEILRVQEKERNVKKSRKANRFGGIDGTIQMQYGSDCVGPYIGFAAGRRAAVEAPARPERGAPWASGCRRRRTGPNARAHTRS